MAQTILPAASRPPEDEWQPTWTVITAPPNLAERWAARRARSFLFGAPTTQLIAMGLCAFEGIDQWNDGKIGSALFSAVLAALFAVAAWEGYAFGLLFGRYEAELRALQTRRPTV